MKAIMISKAAWEEIRRKFQEDPEFRAIPQILLEQTESAKSESTAHRSVQCLKDFELIDERGLLTKRGQGWIDDSRYPSVCQEIIDRIFPQETIPVLSNAEVDEGEKLKCLQYFSDFKEDGAKKTLRFYNMLANAAQNSILKAPAKAGSQQTNRKKTLNNYGSVPTAPKPLASPDRSQRKQEVSLVVDPSFPPEKMTAALEAISLAFPNARFEISMKA